MFPFEGKMTNLGASGVKDLWYFVSSWQGLLLLGTMVSFIDISFSFWGRFIFGAVLVALCLGQLCD